MPAPHAVSDRILRLLRDSLFLEPAAADTDLVDAGLIDSAAFMRLFLLLEDEFDIRIGAEDLALDHFRSVQTMASFVARKQDRAAAG
ncbi:MAG TPA: acyl carrier protein [Longimicrobium sp.]|nr:acyl carrier protein [Longimicrobium sp.]